jgi:biopolymer transport protein ExbD
MAIKIDKGQAAGLINMTPMIDVVFQLLLFFLVASKFSEEERALKLALPSASNARPLTASVNTFTVNILNGQLVVDQNIISPAALERMLREALVRDGRTSVSIRAERQTQMQPVVTVMDVCEKLNLPVKVQVQKQDPRS